MISNTGGSVTLASIWGLLKFYGTEIGVAVGAATTVYGWWKFIWSRRKQRERVRRAVAVGDRLMATAEIEGEGYEAAVAEYRKALALDKNVEIYRRIMTATRRKLEMDHRRGLDSAEDEITSALTGLYEFQTSDSLKNDKGLLIEEAAFLGLGGKQDSALATLRRARELYPEEPEVLARLGFHTDDVELIRRAIAADGKEPKYHYYLADVLVDLGQHAEAIREYRKVKELATCSELRTVRMGNEALSELLTVFKKVAYKEGGGGILAPALGMPVEERVEMLEYFLERYHNLDPAPYAFLAELHHSLGAMDKAHLNIRRALGDDRKWWDGRKSMLRLYARILQDGQLDPATLSEVRTMLGQKA